MCFSSTGNPGNNNNTTVRKSYSTNGMMGKSQHKSPISSSTALINLYSRFLALQFKNDPSKDIHMTSRHTGRDWFV